MIPKFLNFRVPRNGTFDPTCVEHFQRKLLKKELVRAKETLDTHIGSKENSLIQIRSLFPDILIPSIAWHSNMELKEARLNLEEVHKKKLRVLSHEQGKPMFNINTSVKVVDVDVPIPKYVLDTLALGPKNPILDKFDKKDVLAEIDSLLEFGEKRMLSSDTLNEIETATVIYNKKCEKQAPNKGVVLANIFRKDNSLLSVPMDKTNGFAIMSKTLYEKKMGDVLGSKQFGKWVKPRKNAKDPTLVTEDSTNDFLKSLLKENKISDKLYGEMRSVGSNLPRLYGLAKTHKQDIPLRPVLSMCGSAYYKIATKISRWLSVIPEARINASSGKVVEDIKGLVLEENEILISFDVTSLYTNAPVEESILMAAQLLYSGKYQEPPIDKDTFIQLARLCLKNVIMSTGNGLYRQIEGMAMGSPASPLLANIWMSKFDKYFTDKKPKMYRRYVDDILTIIDKNNVDETLEEVNSLHENLNFTHECESEQGEIPFLDMMLLHKGNTVHSTWFSKPTNSGLTLNYIALAPFKYKRSVVRSFVHRIFNSCSDWKYFHSSMEKAKKVLEDNQYPTEFYSPIIYNTLEKLVVKITPEEKPVFDEEVTGKRLFFVQYRGFETVQYINRLRDSGAPIQPILTTRKLRTALPTLKEPIPKNLSSNVIYRIKCTRCDSCYVGMTTRHLITRTKEHLGKNGLSQASRGILPILSERMSHP